MKSLAIVAFATLLALPALAGEGVRAKREARAAERGAAQSPEKQGMREELRARVQERIGIFLTTEISTRVGLDSAKSKQMSDALRAHMERKQARGKQLREEMQKLRALVDAKAADAQVKAQLDVVIGVSSRDDDVHELLRDTARFLTVQEQARLALAMPEIMKELRSVMKEARREGGRGKRGPAGGGFGGPMAPGDDDEL